MQPPATDRTGNAPAAAARVLAELTAVLDRLVALDVAALDDDGLAAVARAMATGEARIAAVTARVVAAAGRCGTVRRSGAPSPAAWLAEETGASRRGTHATTRLAAAIDRVPELGAALADGELGTDKAQLIAAVVDRGRLEEADHAGLVHAAGRMSPEQLARDARRREARADQGRLRRDERLARARRHVRTMSEPDGSLSGSFRLPPVDGQLLTVLLGAATTPDPAGTPADEARTPDQRRADAFVRLLRAAAGAGDLGATRTVRPHVTVVVPAAMLAPRTEDAEAAGAVGTTPDGSVLSAELTRQLLCDATVRRLVLDPVGRPLDVGRATRAWSGAQRAALAAVDGGCRGPRCDRPFGWTDIHHVRWWRHDGTTALDNGLPLCGGCHDLVHHDGWRVALAPATRVATWTSPSGEVVITRPRGPAAPPGTDREVVRVRDVPAGARGRGEPTSMPTWRPPGRPDDQHVPTSAGGQPRLAFERAAPYDPAPPPPRLGAVTPRHHLAPPRSRPRGRAGAALGARAAAGHRESAYTRSSSAAGSRGSP